VLLVRTDADTDSSGLGGTHASMPMKLAIERNLGKWEQPMIIQGFDAETDEIIIQILRELRSSEVREHQ
jgi:hypothetical protein